MRTYLLSTTCNCNMLYDLVQVEMSPQNHVCLQKMADSVCPVVLSNKEEVCYVRQFVRVALVIRMHYCKVNSFLIKYPSWKQ